MMSANFRTTFSPEDLHRLANAPNKIYGLYERLGQYEPVLTGHQQAAEQLGGPVGNKQRTGEVEGPIDSGLGGEIQDEVCTENEPLERPKLILAGDTENHDSGFNEDMDTDDDDDIQKDNCCTMRAPTPPQQTAPVVEKPQPRRPKKNISQFTIFPRSVSPQNMTVSQPRSTTVTANEEPVAPSKFQSESITPKLQRVKPKESQEKTENQSELQRCIRFFIPNKDGDTGLHLAVIHGKSDVMDRLLAVASKDPRVKPAVDEQNGLYQTPLHLATHTQQTDMIRKLLAVGASLNLTDHKGNTPLHVACKLHSTKCLDEMLRSVPLQQIREISEARNNEGLSCVHVAMKHGNTDTLRKLNNIGVDLNMQDFRSGKTALHIAVEKDSLAEVQFLVETCRVAVTAPTYSGCTPLHIASGHGNIAIVAYLLSVGADPELVTDEGDTALDLAGSEQVTTLLTKAAALKWLY